MVICLKVIGWLGWPTYHFDQSYLHKHIFYYVIYCNGQKIPQIPDHYFKKN